MNLYDNVLIRSDSSRKFEQPHYDMKQPGMTREATRYLVEKGVRLLGIDAGGFDRPFDVLVEEAKAGNREQLWEAHFYGKERAYLRIEILSNLDQLPVPHGFQVFAFPVKLDRASAGWIRVVARMVESLDEGTRRNPDPV